MTSVSRSEKLWAAFIFSVNSVFLSGVSSSEHNLRVSLFRVDKTLLVMSSARFSSTPDWSKQDLMWSFGFTGLVAMPLLIV